MNHLFTILLGGGTAALIWFAIGGALYMNPISAAAYKAGASSPAVKVWKNLPLYLGLQFAGILLQTLLWAFVFAQFRPALPPGLVGGLAFGLVLVAVKIIPRLIDMWMQTTYPGRLLKVELVIGVIGSLVVGLVLAWIIR
jgi:hypothetical protein